MISPIMFTNVAKSNCKAVEAPAEQPKPVELPTSKGLQSDCFVKNTLRGPLCGIDMQAI